MPGRDSRLVYSTDGGRVKPARSKRDRAPEPEGPQVPDDGIVRLHRGKTGKGGKPATLITGLPGSEAELDTLLKKLKQSVGAGGSRQGRTLAIQGDHRETLRARLEAMGHRVKLAGG